MPGAVFFVSSRRRHTRCYRDWSSDVCSSDLPEFDRVPSGYDRSRGRLMHEMVIYGVSFDLVGKQPIVLLKTADGNKFLPIWIGHPEAAAILMKLQGASTPRPMTHDLVTDMLSQLDAQVVRITVTELKENTF